MPRTAKRHFDEDLARANALHADAMARAPATPQEEGLRDDILRSAWMFALGAMDAYFCDAYADVVARALRAKNLQDSVVLPESVDKLTLPVGAVFAPTNERENWKWRNAARAMIEKDSMLSTEKIASSLNPFMRQGYKLFEHHTLVALMAAGLPFRASRVKHPAYAAATGAALDRLHKGIRKSVRSYYDGLFQRRHDCIHNCDRPKTSPQRITHRKTRWALDDVQLMVAFCDSHIESEFNEVMRLAGANTTTRNQVGYGA